MQVSSNILFLKRSSFPTLALVSFFLMIVIGKAWAAETLLQDVRQAEKVHITVGKSIVVTSSKPVKRVSIANPEIADFVLLSPREIYLTGKAAGVTNLTLWQNGSVSAIYDLDVAYDISRLKQTLNEVLPSETDLRVTATNDSITLSGRVSNSVNLSQALALAQAYAPTIDKDEKIVRNLVEVGGVHQVMLEVRIAEMSRSLIKRLGINFTYVDNGEFGISRLGGLTELVNPIDANIASGGPFGLFVTPNVNALFRFNHNGATWTGFVDALQDDGLIKILAEPTLIALNGQSAQFLAGGEFPVPVPQGLGTVAIEYKPFGVGLAFTPTVLGENKINLKVQPEVSELDFSTAVILESFVVPGLNVRRASTTIELADGQSFAVAGLLRETIRDNLQKYPLLGDIPILGALFRSRRFQKNETELVIIVTPHLAKPLNVASQELPTDYYIEPNYADIYLFGRMEGQPPTNPAAHKGALDGEFGHAKP